MTSEDLTRKLLVHADDRALMAHLRRWWSPATRHYAYPVIAKLAGGQALDDIPLCTVAALFAEHPQDDKKSRNLGTTCREIAGKERETFETHFRRLLACQDLETDLAPVLHRIAKRAKKEGKGINYSQLHHDLARWKNNAEKIKTAWAKEFWSVPSEDKLDVPQS
jgi:CRISPR type I-E-associated protein CasB/Cse2